MAPEPWGPPSLTPCFCGARPNYATALALARICEAILNDQRSILPVSSYLHDYHGADGVCLGVPTIVGRNGVEDVVPFQLDEDELHSQ